jgi:signal transduction histidine kinase
MGLRQANAESHAAQEHAVAANKTKSEFLANMSHELRTPLNAIIGFSEVMRDQMFGPLGDAHYGDYARLIHSAGNHLLGLINDVLDMSKIEAGKMELSPEKFDLRSAINEAVELMRERAEAAKLELVADVPERALLVFADRRAIHQILLNLLSNAVKFTDVGGAIHLSVACDNGTVCIRVRDTGAGIPDDKLVTIFEPFVQAHRSLTQPTPGTGLGLAISRDLARKMGGDISVESQVGLGSTFTLSLPRS